MKITPEMKKKLTSRKLWMAVAGLVSGIVITVTNDAPMADNWYGIVLAVGSIMAYIFGESWVDSANAASVVTSTNINATTSSKEIVEKIAGTTDIVSTVSTTEKEVKNDQEK